MGYDSKDDVLESNGIFILMQEVDDGVCEDAIKFIIGSNFEAKCNHLTLVINSSGGSTTAGFALIDVMSGSKIPVRTIGIGELASMGLTLFIAGEKGRRALTPNTMILAHQWSWSQGGKEHELIAGVKGFNLLSDMMIKHYSKHTGLNAKRVRDYLMPPHDVWLSAKEALKLGLCDEIKEFR